MVTSGRPLSITITILGAFLLGMWNIWRTLTLFRQRNLLLALGVNLDPRIRLVMALIWSLLLLALVVALWQRRPLVRWLLPLSLFLYALYRMGLLAFFVQSAVVRQGWPTDVVFYTGTIAWATWALHRPGSRSYWRGPED